jgi:retron-type reverse transcriptase
MDTSLTDLWRTWRVFRCGKKPSRAILAFEAELETNLLRLCLDLNSGRYVHGDYAHKIVNEKKRRDIYVATVRDRVVHRLVYDRLVPLFDPSFDYDVWSCRVGKGLDACLGRIAELSVRFPDAVVWRADITKFFDNVNHEVLRRCLRRRLYSGRELGLCDKIIESYSCQKRK